MSWCHPSCRPGRPCFAAQCPNATGGGGGSDGGQGGGEAVIGVGNVSGLGDDIQILDDRVRRIPGVRIGNYNTAGGRNRVIIGGGSSGGWGQGRGGGGRGGGQGGRFGPRRSDNFVPPRPPPPPPPPPPRSSGRGERPRSGGTVRIGVGITSDQDINVGVYDNLADRRRGNRAGLQIGVDNFSRGDNNVGLYNNDLRDGFGRVEVGVGNYAAGSNRIVVDSVPGRPRPPPPRMPPPPPQPPRQWWWPPPVPWWQRARPVPEESSNSRLRWYWFRR